MWDLLQQWVIDLAISHFRKCQCGVPTKPLLSLWTQVSLAVAMSDLVETQWRPTWPQQSSTTWFILCTGRSNTLQRWRVKKLRRLKKNPSVLFHTGAKCKALLLTSDKAQHPCKTIRMFSCHFNLKRLHLCVTALQLQSFDETRYRCMYIIFIFTHIKSTYTCMNINAYIKE